MNEELNLWISATTFQVLGTSRGVQRFVKWAFGLTPSRIAHIRLERLKMTRALWFAVLNHYKWTSAKSGIQNIRNSQPGRPLMQVDHVFPVSKGGYTEWSNLQVLTADENKAKGTKIIDYRREVKHT